MRMFRVVKTAVIFSVAVSVGASIGVIPTTLPDMERRTGGDTARMSFIFTWMVLARIVGAMAVGPFLDSVNGMLVLSICLPLYGVTLALAPTWPSLPVFEALVALATAFDASISSGSMTIIQKMWKTSPDVMLSIIQTTNLMTILGMAVGPQIARPFLGHEVAVNDSAVTSTSTGEGLRPVQMIYLIMGALNVGMAVVCLSTCVFECVTSGGSLCSCFKDQDVDDVQALPGGSDTTVPDDEGRSDKLEPCSRRGGILLAIVVLFAVVSGGCAIVLTGLLFTYVCEYLGWTTDAGTVLSTTKDAMRFVSTAALTFLLPRAWTSPTRQMVVNLVALLAASVLMSAAALIDERTIVLTASGVIVAGLGSYNTCSTIIAVVAETVDVGAHVLITIYSSFGVGSLLVPPLCGALLYETGAPSYPLLMLALTGAGLTLFVLYSVLSRTMNAARTAA